MRFSRLLAFSFALSLCACAHEAENTGVENSSVMVFPATYAFELTSEPQLETNPELDMFPEADVYTATTITPYETVKDDAVVSRRVSAAMAETSTPQRGTTADGVTHAGTVSRFQRNVIVAGGADNPNASPASQYFDDVMDHLETLMAPQIAENNRIALMQEKIPGYKF